MHSYRVTLVVPWDLEMDEGPAADRGRELSSRVPRQTADEGPSADGGLGFHGKLVPVEVESPTADKGPAANESQLRTADKGPGRSTRVP